ncbi:MAG: mechanosensitive ion channel family protein [Lachnospiraceae bacterium]|nr:mechanosensitive ion channel family protein [Lachnospiraceae bacterium]
METKGSDSKNPDVRERKHIRRKYIILGITLFSVLVFSVLLQILLGREARISQEEDNERFFSSTISNLRSNDREIKELKRNFDKNNTIMLGDLVKAYSDSNYKKLESMSSKDQSELLSSAYTSMEDCIWMLIVNRDGDIIISSYYENNGLNVISDGDIGISLEEFHELCDGKVESLIVPNPYIEVEDQAGYNMYLYCEKIPGTVSEDGSKYILLAFSSAIIDTAVSRMSDVSVWLNSSTIGNNGSVFMIAKDDDLVTYGSVKGEDKTGEKASELGFTPEILTDRYTGRAKIGGSSCFISVRSYSSELYGKDNYIITAVPVGDIFGLNIPVIIWNICLFIVFSELVFAYSSYVRNEALKKGEELRELRLFRKKSDKLVFSGNFAGKILPITFTAALVIFGASFYFQALMKLSEVFSDSVAIEEEISNSVEESESLRNDFLYYYDMQYRSRATLMSFIISLHGDEYLDFTKESESINTFGGISEKGSRNLVKDEYNNTVYVINNSKKLMELRDSNEVENIYLISDMGVTMATSSEYWNFSLSSNPDDQSYEFWDILYGKQESIVQEPMISDIGKKSQFIGCTLYYYTCLDDEGNTKYVSYTDYIDQQNGNFTGNEITRHRGLLQVELNPEEGSGVIESSRPSYVLANTKIANDGFLVGLQYNAEIEDYEVFYSPITSMEEETASDLDLTPDDFTGNSHRFRKINGLRYLQSIKQAGDYYILTAVPLESMYAGSIHTALFCSVFSFVFLLGLSLYMIFIGGLDENGGYGERSDSLVYFRYLKSSREWNNSSPNRKLEILMRNSLIVLGVLFIAAIIYEADKYGSNSAIVYITEGQWDKGIHIFSLSACVVIIIIYATAIKLFEHVATLIASVFGSRMVTIMKLSISLIKTVVVVIVLFYCLFLMGIDATRLLASAGILSVVVGLGAQSLVGDLLAGIFLVMEGSVHVGDYVLINDVRGKVTEIGLRTTRYEDVNQNVRIICNNEMKAFVNMSMKYSVVFYRIPVPYGMDYVWIRKVLDEEFLLLYEKHRFLKGIPSCLGIEEFSESSVDLCVRFMCDEADRLNVQRFMHDQIMRIFTENDIHIPFNQLDIHIERELSKAFGDEATQ